MGCEFGVHEDARTVCDVREPQSSATRHPFATLQVTPVVEIGFSFAHAVWDPHFHHDARVLCSLAGELDTDPESRTYLMGPDLVSFRNALQQFIEEEFSGCVLHDGRGTDGVVGDPVHDAVTGEVVQDLIRWVQWPVRPTVEMIALVIAREADRIARAGDFMVSEVELWESARSGVVLGADEVGRAAARLAEAAFHR